MTKDRAPMDGHEDTCAEASGWAEYDLRFVRKSPDKCTEAVSRKGEEQPCDKSAVAVRVDPEDGSTYPVCAYHARADMVPLRVLMEGGPLMTAPAPRDLAEVEHYAARVMSTQDVMFGSVVMNRDGTIHPVPAAHVAAVLHALADFTHDKHMLRIANDRTLATDDFEPEATSLGRYFHALADVIERSHT